MVQRPPHYFNVRLSARCLVEHRAYVCHWDVAQKIQPVGLLDTVLVRQCHGECDYVVRLRSITEVETRPLQKSWALKWPKKKKNTKHKAPFLSPTCTICDNFVTLHILLMIEAKTIFINYVSMALNTSPSFIIAY
jgi:hypothetical protein